LVSKEITVRQGKGRKDRVVPLVGQAYEALKAYLGVRVADPEYDQVFIARNGTSMDVRTVRYRIHKYYEEAGIKKKASVGRIPQRYKTGNENITSILTLQANRQFLTSHFYSTFNAKILGS
jgi:site-specific recombinase XerC